MSDDGCVEQALYMTNNMMTKGLFALLCMYKSSIEKDLRKRLRWLRCNSYSGLEVYTPGDVLGWARSMFDMG